MLNARVSLLSNSRRIKVHKWQISGSHDSLHVAHTACSGTILSAMVLLRMVKCHTQHGNSVHFLKCLIKKKRKQVFPRQEGCTRCISFLLCGNIVSTQEL